MGTKPDLEIIGLLAKEMGVNIGIWTPDKVFEEIRRSVHGYNIPLPVVASGGAAQTAAGERTCAVSFAARSGAVGARHAVYFGSRWDAIPKRLNSVLEAPGRFVSG